jgi:hypothetical protein
VSHRLNFVLVRFFSFSFCVRVCTFSVSDVVRRGRQCETAAVQSFVPREGIGQMAVHEQTLVSPPFFFRTPLRSAATAEASLISPRTVQATLLTFIPLSVCVCATCVQSCLSRASDVGL